jgi:hypothetical protein
VVNFKGSLVGQTSGGPSDGGVLGSGLVGRGSTTVTERLPMVGADDLDRLQLIYGYTARRSRFSPVGWASNNS